MSPCTPDRYWCARIALALALLAVLFAPAVLPAGEAKSAEAPEAKPAEKAEAAEKSAAPELTGEYATMALEVNLAKKQQKQIAQTVAEANKTLAEWREANKAKIEAANAALTQARQAGDRQALQQALVEAQPLFRERQRLQQTYHKKVMDTLTDEQRVKWVGFVLWRTLTSQAKSLALTAAQSDQARALSNTAAEKLLVLPKGEEATQADAQTAHNIQQELVKNFIEDILTDPQRKALRGPPPAGAGPAPDAKPDAAKTSAETPAKGDAEK